MTRSMKQVIFEENSKKEYKNLWKTKKERNEDEVLKRLMVSVVFFFVAFCVAACMAYAEAENFPAPGFVVHEQELVRNGQEVTCKVTMDNLVVVVGEYADDQYMIVRMEQWIKGTRDAEGTIARDAVKLGERQQVKLLTSSKIWEMPGYFEESLTELKKGATFVVLGDCQTYNPEDEKIEDWWCIKYLGGAGFIRKELASEPFVDEEDNIIYLQYYDAAVEPTDVAEEAAAEETEEEDEEELFEPDLSAIEEAPKAEKPAEITKVAKVVNTDTLDAFTDKDGKNPMGTIYCEDIDYTVSVLEWGEKYTAIEYAYNGIALKVYVRTKFLQKD